MNKSLNPTGVHASVQHFQILKILGMVSELTLKNNRYNKFIFRESIELC